MKRSSKKYYVGIVLIILVDSLHNIYFNDDRKFDVYLFYGHARYLDNILLDISRMFSFSVLSYFLISVSKNIFTPLFILSIGIFISYFTYYNQMTSLFLIPLYVLTTLYYNRNSYRK